MKVTILQLKYAKQVAYDGNDAANGAINEQVRVAHDLEWFLLCRFQRLKRHALFMTI